MNKTIMSGSFIAIFAISSQSMAYIPSDVERFRNDTNCENCDLSDASFTSLYESEKNDAILDGTYFTRTTLNNYVIKNSKFKNDNFVKSSLHRVGFRNSEFKNTNFSFSSLSKVNFLNSNLMNINFKQIKMSGSFSSCQIYDVDFSNSYLNEVSFPKAILKNVNFENSSMKGADFSRAHLENINFKNVNLSYAILIGSNIENELLKQAKTYKCAILSDGTVYTNNGEYNCK